MASVFSADPDRNHVLVTSQIDTRLRGLGSLLAGVEVGGRYGERVVAGTPVAEGIRGSRCGGRRGRPESVDHNIAGRRFLLVDNTPGYLLVLFCVKLHRTRIINYVIARFCRIVVNKD